MLLIPYLALTAISYLALILTIVSRKTELKGVQMVTASMAFVLFGTLALSSYDVTVPFCDNTVLSTSGDVPLFNTSNSYTTYNDVLTKGAILNVHGGISTLDTGLSLNPTTNISITSGISRLVFAALTTTDPVGTIHITGDYRDRNSWELIENATEDLVISGVATERIAGEQYSDAVITDLWWEGPVTVYTDDVNYSDITVLQIAFDQFADFERVTLEGIDLIARRNNQEGSLNLTILSIFRKENNVVDINSTLELEIPSGGGPSSEDKLFRIKRDGGLRDFNGTTEGFILQVLPLPLNKNYWEELSTRVQITLKNPINELGLAETVNNTSTNQLVCNVKQETYPEMGALNFAFMLVSIVFLYVSSPLGVRK